MLPLISSLVSFSLSIATIFFVFHPAINLRETSFCVFDLPHPFLLPSDMFRPSLLHLLPLSVAPIGWSLTPFISFFLFILTTLALLSWIPERVCVPPPLLFYASVSRFPHLLLFQRPRPQFCWSLSSMSAHVCLQHPFLGSNL